MLDERDDRVRAALRAEAASLPLTVTPAMVEERIAGRSASRPAWQLALGLALLAIAIAAGAVAVGSGLVQLPSLTIDRPQPAAKGLAWDEVELPPGLSSPTVVLASGGGFVIYSTETNLVGVSADGRTWERRDTGPIRFGERAKAWDGTVLTWDEADGSVTTWRTDGNRAIRSALGDVQITSAAIGPRGIVALTRSRFSETDVIDAVLGPEWVDRVAYTCGPMCPSGILTVTRDDGQTVEIILEDHGFGGSREPGWSGGWYSVTGTDWFPIPAPPLSDGGLRRSVAAAADGFYASTDDGTMWQSSDGLTWRAIGSGAAGSSDLVTWGEHVLRITDLGYEIWTSDGSEELELGPIVPQPGGCCGATVIGAGPLGILVVDREADLVTFSTDGFAVSQEALPAGHDWSSGFDSWADTQVAVGRDAAVVLLWEWSDGIGERPTLWRVTSR